MKNDALASVDNKTASGILSSIREQENRTIVMISHQLSAAAACDRILVLEQGRLVPQTAQRHVLEAGRDDSCAKIRPSLRAHRKDLKGLSVQWDHDLRRPNTFA